jgi:malate synthase
MPEKQLNIWIPEDVKNYLSQRADEEKRGMNMIVTDLLRQEIARKSGEVVETQALPVIREIVAAEVRQATAQLRRDLREDRQQEEEDRRDFLRKQIDRIAALTVQAVRNASITRRLVYTVLAKSFGATYASKTYDDAKEKAYQELLPKKAIEAAPEHDL